MTPWTWPCVRVPSVNHSIIYHYWEVIETGQCNTNGRTGGRTPNWSSVHALLNTECPLRYHNHNLTSVTAVPVNMASSLQNVLRLTPRILTKNTSHLEKYIVKRGFSRGVSLCRAASLICSENHVHSPHEPLPVPRVSLGQHLMGCLEKYRDLEALVSQNYEVHCRMYYVS